MDQRFKELTSMNKKGKFKSQGGGGGNEQILVKRQVPWAQSHILTGIPKIGCHMIASLSFNGFLACVT